MNTLEQIRTALEKYNEVVAAYEHSGLAVLLNPTIYDPHQATAMRLLAAVLPLLNAAVAIELNDGKMPEFQWFSLIQDYENEVAKLLQETEVTE